MRKLINIVTESLLAESLPTPDALTEIDVIAYAAYQNIDWSGGGGEYVKTEYENENGVVSDDDDDDDFFSDSKSEVDETSPDFMSWFKGWVEDRAWNAWGNFSHLFDAEGNAILYRVITAPANWQPGERHPGIYWSWDVNAAQAHWGTFSTGDATWRMTAKINMRDIDWVATLVMNIDPSFEDEKEIRINEAAPVELLKVERLD